MICEAEEEFTVLGEPMSKPGLCEYSSAALLVDVAALSGCNPASKS